MKEIFDKKKSLENALNIKEFKDLNDYLGSNENILACKPFDELNNKYILLQLKYSHSFSELSKDVELRSHRREYSRGGLGFHRGYYSPSNLDLVIGGVNRGKLVQKSVRSKYNYEYIFDLNNKLICVYTYYRNTINADKIELFIYENDKTLSLIYDSDHSLNFISECHYDDNNLTKYESALCDLCYGGNGCTEISVEINTFENNMLKQTNWYRYNPSNKLLSQFEYLFSRDSAGLLSTYRVKQIGGYSSPISNKYNNPIYNVRIRR